jgi:hypothetical protein
MDRRLGLASLSNALLVPLLVRRLVSVLPGETCYGASHDHQCGYGYSRGARYRKRGVSDGDSVPAKLGGLESVRRRLATRRLLRPAAVRTAVAMITHGTWSGVNFRGRSEIYDYT